MDAAALERQLREHPDDAASWQVYGDLLLERGDERGELIHAGLRPDHIATAKVAGLPTGVKVVRAKYGFATKVSVIWTDAAALTELFESPELRFVTALRIGVDNVESDPDQEDEELERDDGEMPPPLDLGAFDQISLPQLRELDLRYLRIGPAPLPKLSDLQTLDLRYCGIGDEGAAQLVQYPHLEVLHLQRNMITAKGLAALQLNELVKLDLRYNRLGVAGARALAAAPFVHTLKRLDVYRNDLTDAGVELVKQTPGTFLRTLWSTR